MISEGQAREYCYEDISLIENYEKAMNDKTQTWVCHHRVETIMNCSAEELIAQGCYTDRPAHDLIFLTRAEHNKLHNTGKKHSEKTRAKISASMSGENHPMYGKHHSEETRAKMHAALNRPEILAKLSAANNGKKRTEETKAKMSASHKGKPKSAKTRAKMSEARRGERLGWHFWNNGIENRYCKECPGPEWKRGMLRNKQS